jgi:hypothetical protein
MSGLRALRGMEGVQDGTNELWMVFDPAMTGAGQAR